MLATMRGKHFNISKFLFYSLRILNKVGYKDNAKLPILYHTVASFDNILEIELEYFTIAESKLLQPVKEKIKNKQYRVFIAVKLNGVRLIDNMKIN